MIFDWRDFIVMDQPHKVSQPEIPEKLTANKDRSKTAFKCSYLLKSTTWLKRLTFFTLNWYILSQNTTLNIEIYLFFSNISRTTTMRQTYFKWESPEISRSYNVFSIFRIMPCAQVLSIQNDISRYFKLFLLVLYKNCIVNTNWK